MCIAHVPSDTPLRHNAHTVTLFPSCVCESSRLTLAASLWRAAPPSEQAEALVSQQIVSVLVRREQSEIVCITRDHNFVVIDSASLALKRTYVGYNDEVIDIRYIPNTSLDGSSSRRVVVATNSEQLRVFDLDTFDASLVGGHADTILALDVSPDGRFVATAAKDGTARCVAVHAARVDDVSTMYRRCCDDAT